jgi:hypothetical protein
MVAIAGWVVALLLAGTSTSYTVVVAVLTTLPLVACWLVRLSAEYQAGRS